MQKFNFEVNSGGYLKFEFSHFITKKNPARAGFNC